MKYIIPFLSFTVFFGCYDDKGNYDYHEVNGIEVTLDDVYSYPFGEPVRIVPEIRMTIADPADKDRFSYLWTKKTSSSTYALVTDTLGREMVLDLPSTGLGIGTHYIGFQVTDMTNSEVFEYVSFQIRVVTSINRGLLLIGEDRNGNVDIGMVAMISGQDTVLMPSLFDVTGLPALTGPISLQASGEIWLFAQNGSYYLNGQSFASSTDNIFNRKMYYPDSGEPILLRDMGPVHTKTGGGAGDGNTRFVVTMNNDLYVEWMSNGDYYSFTRNNSEEGERLPVKGRVLYAMNSGMYHNIVWYDGTYERFLYYKGPGGPTSPAFSAILYDGGPSDPFPWSQKEINRTYIYGENTHTNNGNGEGRSNAIMQDINDGSLYIYRILAQNSNGVPMKEGSYDVINEAIDLATAEHRAFAGNRSAVFYNKGNKVYAYDFSPNYERVFEFDLWQGKEITMMKFDIGGEPGGDYLYIAYWDDANGGVLQKYEMGSNPDVIEIFEVPECRWEFDMKVTNMQWRG